MSFTKKSWSGTKKIDDSRHHTNTVVQEGNNVAVEIPEAQEKINWENK